MKTSDQALPRGDGLDAPPPASKAPPALLLALCVAAVVHLAVIWGWRESVIGLPYDDAYYYFEIGRRLAAGEGSTFDGIHATNGYHPLWLAVCAIAYLPGWAGELPVRLLLSVQVAAIGVGSWLALRHLGWRPADVAGSVAGAVLALGWLLVPAIVRTQLNGLESGLVALTHGAVLACLLSVDGPIATASRRLRWALGLSLAAAFLARTDAALLLPLIALFAAPDVLRAPRSALGLLPVLGPPTLTVILFLALNQVFFDAPMQVSGSLKRVPPGLSGAIILALAALWILTILVVGRLRPTGALPRVELVLRRAGPHLAFLGAITGYYLGLQTFPRLWYFAPVTLIGLVVCVALVLDLTEKARREAPNASPARAVAPIVALVALPLIVAIPLTGLPMLADEALALRRAHLWLAHWLDRELPPGTRVGSWDAGLVGYSSRQPVINLDGVVNDVGWLRAMRGGTAGERLRQEGVVWYANHSMLEGSDCKSILDGLAQLDPAAAQRATLVAHQPFTQRGSFNGGPLATHQMAACVVYTGPPPGTAAP